MAITLYLETAIAVLCAATVYAHPVAPIHAVNREGQGSIPGNPLKEPPQPLAQTARSAGNTLKNH